MGRQLIHWVCWFAMVPALLGAGPSQTVILVRHAERAGGMAADVGLSDAGRCRAEVLTGMLADSGLSHIFTSEVARTQQTADPVGKKLGVRPEAIMAKDYDTWVKKLRAAAGVSLVVGHSNTLPEIIARLGAGTVAPIGDNDYDRMYVMTITGGNASVVLLHYPGCPR
jgi:phosphohistidine phosphatase SixA